MGVSFAREQCSDNPSQSVFKVLPARVLVAVGVATIVFSTARTNAFGQACPSPVVANSTQCTVVPGSTVTVSPANAIGLNASGVSGQITATGITENLAVAETTGALAQSGSTIIFDGSTLRTTAVTTANSAGQIGLRAVTGGTVQATGASLALGPANGATAASNMIGTVAEAGSVIDLTNTSIAMLGGAAGLNNVGLLASGSGADVRFSGGSITTVARSSFGVQAIAGGHVSLTNGPVISTSGAGSAVIAGSHSLYAAGAGSQITGDGVIASAGGNFTNAARVEAGASITLTNSALSTSGTSAADTDPTSAARVLSGGVLRVSGGTLTATGQRGDGFSVQDAGSQAFIFDSVVSAAGTRANAARIFNGGQATVTNSSLLSQNFTSIVVQDAGSAISLLDSAVRSTAVLGFGLRVTTGGAATMVGGSSATEGRDSPALAVSNGTLSGKNVVVSTSGNDNAMGALSDGNSTLALVGGSVTTTGDAVRQASFPHALGARNPGGLLTATGTAILTTGYTAMGAVADDGGTVVLSGNSIRTLGDRSIGLYSVTEQVGSQFVADLTASNVTLETFGLNAHAVAAQARNDVAVEKASATVSNSTIATHGTGAVGLRATLGDYGTRPITGRGEAVVISNDSTVLTEGIGAHGALSRDNPTSVTMNATSVTTTGAFAQGAVAEAGGRIIGNSSSVTATGANAAALFVTGSPGAVSSGTFSNSSLINVSGPTIGVGGSGDVSLTNSRAGGSGEWLRVGAAAIFPPLAASDVFFGIADPDNPGAPPPGGPLPPSVGAPNTPGLANVTLRNSVVIGSAFTAPGSVSNVTLLDDSTWIMTGSSNVTNLVNDPSLIQFTAPIGDPTLLSSYKTLTTVNYFGIGGVIGLNTFLGADPSPSDRLVIDGGNASGFSPLRIANTVGRGALTVANGILVVDAMNGATTNPGTFALAGPVVAGPYEYGLFRGSVDSTNPEAWYLRSTINCALDPDNPACGRPSPDPANYRIETSLYVALPSIALLYGRNTLDTLHERVGEEEDGRFRSDPENGKVGWGRVIGVGGAQKGDVLGVLGSGGPRYSYGFVGLQAGMDVYRHDKPDGSRDQAGAYFAIGGDRGRVTHFDRRQGDSNFAAYTLGGYWTHFGPTGWYTDAILQGTFYDMSATANRGLPSMRTGGQGAAASLEAGRPFRHGDGWFIEPQAQLVYQNIHINDASDIAAQIRFSDVTSLAGRVGARFGRTWAVDDASSRTITAWIRPNLWNEFLGNPTTSFSSETGFIPFQASLGGLWGELNAGVSGQVTSNTTLFANASYQSRFDGGGYAYTGKAGVRVNW